MSPYRLTFSLFLVVALVASAHAHAQAPAWKITVTGGKSDATNVPVKTLLLLNPDQATAKRVELTAGDSKLVGQLTGVGLLTDTSKLGANDVPGELHFIIPAIKAGQSITYSAAIQKDAANPAKTFAWKDTPGKQMDLVFGDRPVARYMYERVDNSTPDRRHDTFKIYHHVFDPTGKQLLTKGPGGLYTHHRGIFYGFNRVSYAGKTADVWHCNNNESQTQEKFIDQEAGPVLARHRLAIDWHGKDDAVFAKEQRELTFYNISGGTLIDFASRLTSDQDVKLDGDPQHAGFHFRAAQEVAATTKGQTYYLRPDGKDKPGATRNWAANGDRSHKNLPWNAQSLVIGGTRYTVCYVDRPTNPKEARFSERDYGRFGSYFEYQLTPQKPLEVAYRVWLQPGELEGPAVQSLSDAFVTPPTVTK